jgi:hypothetical protein
METFMSCPRIETTTSTGNGVVSYMNSKAMKIAPLFFILLMTLSSLMYTPAMTTSNPTTIASANAPSLYFAPPSGVHWTNWSSSYATYNGHWSQWRYEWDKGYNGTDIIMTANMTAIPSGAFSNVSVALKEFFTGATVENAEGIWYSINLGSGDVADSWRHQPGINGYPMFFCLPHAWTYGIGNHVLIAAPFNDTAPIDFTVIAYDTVLGVPCVVLNHVTSSVYDYLDQHREIDQNITLWLNTNNGDDSGLLMRIIGHDTQYYSYNYGAYWYHYNTEMSMEIGQTNILTLTLPPIENGMVPWMGIGKYLQYNIQGSGYIDAQLTDHLGTMDLQLPYDTKFRTIVSANLTLKVDKGTTAYVDPYGSSRYVWVLHLMLNNTQLLLPDLRRALQYLNATGMPVPYPEGADMIIGMLAPFNKTGLVADTWFLVDNQTGQMYWPGVHFSSLSGYSPSMTETIGELLSEGLGLQLLSWFAQNYMYQGWTMSNPPETQTIHQDASDPYTTRTIDGTLAASITCVGTEYLNFPGGGGGHCWRINSNLNGHIVETAFRDNRSIVPSGMSPGDFLDNSTMTMTGNGFTDIERTSGFPLAFGLNFHFTLASEPRFTPYYWFSTYIDVALDLSVKVPHTNIWFTNVPVYLTLGLGGGNTTSPESTFGDHGFDVWMNGANDVVVTSSSSAPPDSTAPPSGTLPFIYLDIKGIPAGSGNIILYVFYNRTKVHDLGLDENSLKLYTFNATSHNWQALSSTHLVINATHGCIFAVLNHLSYFAVLGSSPAGAGIPTLYIIIAGVAVIAVLAAVVYVKKGRSRGGLT